MLLDELYAQSRGGKLAVQPFVYVFTWNTLAASAAAQQVTTNISNDADFIVRAVTGKAYSAAGVPVVDPDYLIQFQDLGSGRNFQSATMHWGNVVGTAENPYMMPEPWLVYGGGSVVATLTNNTALAARVDLSFNGYKVKYLSGYSREEFIRKAGLWR